MTGPTSVDIYVLVDPRTQEIRYVGKTVRGVARRLSQHIAAARCMTVETKSRRSCWIRSLLAAGVTPEICLLESVSPALWEDRERFWIAQFRSAGARLVNGTDGGDGAHGMVMSEEARRKQSESLRAYLAAEREKNGGILRRPKASEEAKRKMSESHRRRWEAGISDKEWAARAEASKRHRGRVLSAELRRRIGEATRAGMNGLRSEKTCSVCGALFMGIPASLNCSKSCTQKASRARRAARAVAP